MAQTSAHYSYWNRSCLRQIICLGGMKKIEILECPQLQEEGKTWPTHTASFWNIIIQWTSPDDLTENKLFYQRFGCPMKLDTSRFSVKSQSPVLHFCHLTSFSKETKETNFSVKSSWEVRWIIMFQKDVVCNSAVVTEAMLPKKQETSRHSY